MDKARIANALNILGVPFNDKENGWFELQCLFAHKHNGGTDHHPSASIKYSADDGAGYNCWACQSTYKDLKFALWALIHDSGKGIPHNLVIEALQASGDAKISLPKLAPKVSSAIGAEIVASNCTPFPKAYLERFPSVLTKRNSGDYAFPEALEFLISRQTPLQVIRDFDFRWDMKYKRVLVPTYLKGKTLAGVDGRFIHHNPGIQGENTSPKYWVYLHKESKHATPYSNTDCVWFRQSTLSQKKPLVLVEGMFDAARVYQHYRNVTCIGGASVPAAKLPYLKGCKEVIFIPDNDLAGREAAKRLRHDLPTLKVIQLPSPSKDVGAMTAFEVRRLLAPHLKLAEPLWTKKDADLYGTPEVQGGVHG